VQCEFSSNGCKMPVTHSVQAAGGGIHLPDAYGWMRGLQIHASMGTLFLPPYLCTEIHSVWRSTDRFSVCKNRSGIESFVWYK